MDDQIKCSYEIICILYKLKYFFAYEAKLSAKKWFLSYLLDRELIRYIES